MNVAFAVDGSSKMDQENFTTTLGFVVNVSYHLNVSLDKTWIFLAYGNVKKAFKTNVDLNSLTQRKEFFPNGSHVILGTTLELVWEQFHQNAAHRVATNVVIVVTAYKSYDDITVPAVRLKRSGATIFTIGVGTEYSSGQLREIASEPDENHMISINSWEGLTSKFASHVAGKICQGK